MYEVWINDCWMGIHHGFNWFDALERACRDGLQSSYHEVAVTEGFDVPDDWNVYEHTSLFDEHFITVDDDYEIYVEGYIYDISDGGEEEAKKRCEAHNFPWEWMKETLGNEKMDMLQCECVKPQ